MSSSEEHINTNSKLDGFLPASIDDEEESPDVSEDIIREQMPEILDILLLDRTTSTVKKTHNIIWANNSYVAFGAKQYAETSEITPNLVTGPMSQIIKPRALKSQELKKTRTKAKAEVFTPTWVVKKQNDAVDENFVDDNLNTYVSRTWLEITCGEAPYIASRYDMETGHTVALGERVGFLDRKLRRINAEVIDLTKWQALAETAMKACFGFEWSGDSLLLARENLLYTYRDYYFAKWHDQPRYEWLKRIAEIISYNVFQMDGLKYIVPLSERKEKISSPEISLFDDIPTEEKWVTKSGKRVKVMNWATGQMEFFDKEITARG